VLDRWKRITLPWPPGPQPGMSSLDVSGAPASVYAASTVSRPPSAVPQVFTSTSPWPAGTVNQSEWAAGLPAWAASPGRAVANRLLKPVDQPE
jgi:hypothetical protein